MNLFGLKQHSGIATLVVISAWSVIFLGFISFFGWIIDIPLLIGVWVKGYFPIGPASSICFILFGTVISSGICQKEVSIRKKLLSLIVILITIYSLLIIVSAMFKTDLVFNEVLFPNHSDKQLPVNRMSPYTGFLFFLSGVSILFKIYFQRNKIVLQLISGTGTLIGFAGFVALLGYLFGTPFLYSGTLIPMSVNTAFGMLLLGTSLLCLGGSDTFFSRHFSGLASSAIVLRVFLPIIILGILFEAMVFVFLTQVFELNPALILALLTVLSVILTTVIIVWVSKFVFKKADLAEGDRKKAEEIIHHERILLRTLIDNLPDTIYVKDFDARKVLANNADVSATGHTHESEILGKTDLEIFNKIDGEHGYMQDMQVLKTGKPLLDQEDEYVNKSGKVSWLRTSKIPLNDINGNVVGLVGIGHDITARKAQEEQMLLMTHALKSLNDCVSITDINDRIIYVNDAFLRTYGYERSELIGQNIKIVRKKDQLDDAIEQLILPTTIESGWHGELINCKKDGTEFLVEISTSPVRNEAGDIIALSGIATDITDRKRMEKDLNTSKEKYRILIENQGEGLGQVDSNEVFIFVNPAAEQIFGVEKNGLIGHNLSEFVTKESMELIQKESEKRSKNEKSSYEIEIIDGKGERKFVLVTATPQIDSEGKHQGAFGIFRDITERKKIETQLAKQTDELRELNLTKDKFFSIIAHDLRSPFSAILGLSGLLTSYFDDYDRESIKESVWEIDKASKQAFSLLENLLEWARSQTGKMDFVPIAFDLVDLVDETVSVAQSFANKKGVKLEIETPAKMVITADRNMIYTIMRNLISNALKFTPQHGKVIISLEDTTDFFQFSVTDSGVGISDENKAKLFKVDETFTNTGTNNERGTGLGLILCKEFIDKHNGKISVQSELKKGSTFIVQIPKTLGL